jgi:hypothetical protein
MLKKEEKKEIIQVRVEISQVQWLMPLLLVTWKADNRRIMGQGQPRKIVSETPSPKIARAYFVSMKP